MNKNYSIKELIQDKEDLELEIYEKIKNFQEKYEFNVSIELIKISDIKEVEYIRDVIIHIGV